MSKTAIAIILVIAIVVVLAGGAYTVSLIMKQDTQASTAVQTQTSQLDALKQAKDAADVKAAQAQAQLGQLQGQVSKLESTIDKLDTQLTEEQAKSVAAQQQAAIVPEISNDELDFTDLKNINKDNCRVAIRWAERRVSDIDDDLDTEDEDLQDEQLTLDNIEDDIAYCETAKTNASNCPNTADVSVCLTPEQETTCGRTVTEIRRELDNLDSDRKNQKDDVKDIEDTIDDLDLDRDDARDLEKDIKDKCRNFGVR
ncbi:hypothetical protein HZB01_03440 [Candidatus Woesearchaeota archaeon]|nr:hypothetical protein [Candidatus Woesearchaeota archaeon]